MEVIAELFQKHISTEKLYEHRSVWIDNSNMMIALITKFFFMTSISNSDKENELKYIVSGSNVEGANLARLFFEDTKGEVEIDVMCPLFQINEIESFELCDQRNPMFVHIVWKMDTNQSNEFVKKFGDEFQNYLIYDSNKDKSFFSSSFLKCKAKDEFNMHPDVLKQIAGYTTNVIRSEWDPEDAAGTFDIIFSNDSKYTGTRESDPQNFEKELMNKVLNVTPEFEQQANDEMQMLKKIQDNFLASRLEGKSKVEQISLAIKWSNQSLLLIDILCNHRLETVCYVLQQAVRLETKESVETMRAQLKERIEKYLSIFNALSHEPDSVKTEQALLDFESYAKSLRCLIALNMFLQQELLFMKTIHVGQRKNEELSHSTDELTKFSEKVTNLSLDLVMCCKCNFWPELAAEWPNRKREWPEQSTIQQIVSNGIHVVCKKLRHSEIDWRLSFSVAEIEITRQWTSWQHYIYFIFKSIFYKYLKPLSSKKLKVVTSFLVKTVMLNVSESFSQSWWCKKNAGECLNVLLMTLLSAFETKSLPHHFVRTFNLLERASSDKESERILDRAVDILNSLLLKPEEEVSKLSATLENVKEFVNICNTQKAMGNELLTTFSSIPSIVNDPFHNYDFNKWQKK